MITRPILMSAPMAVSTWQDLKTNTRRLIKNPDYYGCLTGDCPHSTQSECNQAMAVECPYGQVGDQLWVKETYALEEAHDSLKASLVPLPLNGPIWWRADGEQQSEDGTRLKIHRGRWRPSIFMRRAFSRSLLEITGTRAERLQDISEADAEAEGVDFLRQIPDADETLTARQLYEILWEHINGAGSWALNPWVWCISFKRLSK